jgi:DNA-binding transcriptional MocR family regulator
MRANQPHIGPLLAPELRGVLGDWRRGPGALRDRLTASLREGIESGDLVAGLRLPPERTLAAQLGVGRGTVVAAYEALRERGLLERRQGSGTVVRSEVGALASARAAELATALQHNLLFRGLDPEGGGGIDLVGTHGPASPEVREALVAAAAGLDLGALSAHHGYHPFGYPPLRRAVAAHLTGLGLPSSEEEVLITGGAQQAISVLATCLVEPGAVVVVEDPTFPGAIDAFRTAGARVITVPVRSDGVDLDALAGTLAEHPVRAVYLMPTFHNPMGCVLPEAGRRRLAALARAHDVPVIEDGALSELSLGDPPPPPVAVHAGRAPLVSVGSMSKLFWGGLRIGWIRGPRPMITHLGRVKAVADLGSSIPSQVIAAGLIGRAAEVRAARCAELRTNLDLLGDLLARHLPGWTWRRPEGGVSLWVRLPSGSASELAAVAAIHGLAIVPGPVMSARGSFDDHLRLPLTRDAATLREGVDRLARAWHELDAAANDRSQRFQIVV